MKRYNNEQYLSYLEDLSYHFEDTALSYESRETVQSYVAFLFIDWVTKADELTEELIRLYKIMPIDMKQDRIYLTPAAARFSGIASIILNGHRLFEKYKIDEYDLKRLKSARKALHLWQEKMGRRLPGIIL
jgi:hypothetical protein